MPETPTFDYLSQLRAEYVALGDVPPPQSRLEGLLGELRRHDTSQHTGALVAHAHVCIDLARTANTGQASYLDEAQEALAKLPAIYIGGTGPRQSTRAAMLEAHLPKIRRVLCEGRQPDAQDEAQLLRSLRQIVVLPNFMTHREREETKLRPEQYATVTMLINSFRNTQHATSYHMWPSLLRQSIGQPNVGWQNQWEIGGSEAGFLDRKFEKIKPMGIRSRMPNGKYCRGILLVSLKEDVGLDPLYNAVQMVRREAELSLQAEKYKLDVGQRGELGALRTRLGKFGANLWAHLDVLTP